MDREEPCAPLGARNRGWGGRKWLVGGEGRSSSSVDAGEGAPVVLGVGSWAPEHHQAMRKESTGTRWGGPAWELQ